MRPIIVMGVAGVGKSLIASQLACILGRPLADADTFHTPESIAKMRSGIPLTDEDRWPWLNRLGAHLKEERDVIIACSLLKARYRTKLRRVSGRYDLVFLDVPYDVAYARAKARTDKNISEELVASQFAALERPRHGYTIDATMTPGEVTRNIINRLNPRNLASPYLPQ